MQHQAMDFKTILHAAHYAVLVFFFFFFYNAFDKWSILTLPGKVFVTSDKFNTMLRHSKTHRVNPMVHKNTMAGWEALRRRTCFLCFEGDAEEDQWWSRRMRWIIFVLRYDHVEMWQWRWFCCCWCYCSSLLVLLLMVMGNYGGFLKWVYPKPGGFSITYVYIYIYIGLYIYYIIWRLPEIGVPLNHPFIDTFSITNHPFGGTPIYGNLHIHIYIYTHLYIYKIYVYI